MYPRLRRRCFGRAVIRHQVRVAPAPAWPAAKPARQTGTSGAIGGWLSQTRRATAIRGPAPERSRRRPGVRFARTNRVISWGALVLTAASGTLKRRHSSAEATAVQLAEAAAGTMFEPSGTGVDCRRPHMNRHGPRSETSVPIHVPLGSVPVDPGYASRHRDPRVDPCIRSSLAVHCSRSVSVHPDGSICACSA